MFPMALACGNTFIMKPSEQDPGAAMLLCEMAMECGIPAGVLNVIHGTKPGQHSGHFVVHGTEALNYSVSSVSEFFLFFQY